MASSTSTLPTPEYKRSYGLALRPTREVRSGVAGLGEVDRKVQTGTTAGARRREKKGSNENRRFGRCYGGPGPTPTDYMFSAAAAEAVKRKWQQQQLQTQDDMDGIQRKLTAAAAANLPDYTISRKHTIVISDTFSPEEANRHHKSPSGATRCEAIAFLLLALVW